MTSPNDSQPNNSSPGDGLSLLDLGNLPPAQYKLMRVVMREGECNYTRICILMEAEQVSRAEVEKLVKDLTDQQWLVKAGDNYRANLRRKNSRVLSEFQPPRRQTTTLRGIWDSIENTEEDQNK